MTIKVPVVFMTRNVMILMRANPFRGPLEGVGPENRDFLGPEMATSEVTSAIVNTGTLIILST